MRALTTFREPLRKRQIMELAIDDVNKSIEVARSSPVETQIFFKRLKVYVDEFIRGNETFAIDQYNQDKRTTYNNVDVSLTRGAALLDYEKDPIYADLAYRLKERKQVLDMAFKMKDSVYDNEGIEVPKVPVKDYRKDSLNVRL